MDSIYANLFLGLFGLGVLGLYMYIGLMSSNINSAAEINKQIIIVSSVTGILTIIFGFLTFIYFSINVNYVTPFLLISNTVVLTISLIALSVASLRSGSS